MTTMRTLFAIGTMLVLGTSVASAQGATVTCKDGTSSAGGRGACSSHGGILTPAMKAKMDAEAKEKAAKAAEKASKEAAKVATAKAKADAKAAKKAASTAAKAETKAAKVEAKAEEKEEREAKGASAECKDHTYSHAKTHQGACSRHGGVAKFLDGK